mmetsp:Transcript_8432/g.13637  ORF Transcript_8432/g.13637 Transcript_8432/m.13637 type:complete len:599 (+) Transcript_8432:106-1902(+)
MNEVSIPPPSSSSSPPKEQEKEDQAKPPVPVSAPPPVPPNGTDKESDGGKGGAENQDVKEGGDQQPAPTNRNSSGQKLTVTVSDKPPPQRAHNSPLPREPSDVKIRRTMLTVMNTINVSDKAMESCLKKEEGYWNEQEEAFKKLLDRVYSGQKTLKDFAYLLKSQQKAALYAAKSFMLGGSWKAFGEEEGLGLKAVCITQHNLLNGVGEYFETIKEQMYEKPAAEALKCAKEIGVFAAKIKKETLKLQKALRYQRDLANKRWAQYKYACEKRHKCFEAEKTMRPSDDPYLAFEIYKREVVALHKQQASYNSVMGQMMAEFETREMTRARNLRSLMLGMVSTQKAFFEFASLSCQQAISKLTGVRLEEDLLRFRHSGGLLHNPHTADIKFEAKAMGLDFKGNRITGVREGSQAHVKGVKQGFRILEVNGRSAPAGHKDIAALLETLKKAGNPIHIKFGTKPAGMIFDRPPPNRKTQHIQIISNAECATVGDLSRMSKTMGFSSWTKMYCVITNSGIMHVMNSRDASTAHSSIQLHQSVIRLAPKIDQHAFEIEEATSGFFGSGTKIHTFRTKTENALVDWVVDIKKFLKTGKTEIKATK